MIPQPVHPRVPRAPRRPVPVAAGLLAGALLLAGCGGSGSDTATTPSSDASTTAAPATTPATDAPTTTGQPTTTVFTPPPMPDPSPAISSPGSNRLTVLGDSVILGAKADLPGALKGWDVDFDAAESRFITQGLGILKAKVGSAEQAWSDQQRKVEQAYADAGKPAPSAPPKPTKTEVLGRVVVIHLCTNYQVGMGFESQISAYMDWLKEMDRVVWVTCAEWSPGQTEANEAIRAAKDRYPNYVVADWARYSPTPGYTYADNIHLDGAGRRAITDLVVRLVGPAPTPNPPAPTTTLPPPTTTTTTAPSEEEPPA